MLTGSIVRRSGSIGFGPPGSVWILTSSSKKVRKTMTLSLKNDVNVTFKKYLAKNL
jgi:hypothetical protein